MNLQLEDGETSVDCTQKRELFFQFAKETHIRVWLEGGKNHTGKHTQWPAKLWE